MNLGKIWDAGQNISEALLRTSATTKDEHMGKIWPFFSTRFSEKNEVPQGRGGLHQPTTARYGERFTAIIIAMPVTLVPTNCIEFVFFRSVHET